MMRWSLLPALLLSVFFSCAISAQTPIEPAPAGQAAPPQDLWERIRGGFALEREMDRRRVRAELKWYVDNPDYLERVARRAAPHLYHVVTELENHGLPLEFALLPIMESAYDPFAYSHGRAAGLWQFVPATANLYGLRIDWWYDGRRDVRAATAAAIAHLEHLHNLFDGDWLLALAAYNAGQGNVQSSIRAANLPPGKVNFWSLKVLRETSTYVPRLLAISDIIANPGRYNVTLPRVPDEPYWEVVAIGSQLDLHKAAGLAGLTAEELYSLNPGFNQWATHPDGPHELLVPAPRAAPFRLALANLAPADRLSWRRHKVRRGENLGLIAKRYRTTIDTIRTANGISGHRIRAGDSLLIPAADGKVNYNMTKDGRLASRQAALAASHGSEPIVHTVRPGDSFWKIARQYGVGMREVARWNGMGTTGLLHPGTELKIFSKQPAGVKRPLLKSQVRKLNYRVRKGESLSLIASKFNVSVQKIKSWNHGLHLRKYIHPGDRLTLYVDVTQLVN